MRIDAYQFAIVIGVAIAGPRRARLDVTHHRTGIAADLIADRGGCRFGYHEQPVAGVSAGSVNLPTTHPVSAKDHRTDVANGHFVCIRTMLRAVEKAVKLRFIKEAPLPNINSIACSHCS
jgi:hypothetical protein